MATHYRHPIDTRRWRALEQILELLTRLVEWWTEFWWATTPTNASHGNSDHGATDRWADTLHDIDIIAVHDALSDEPGLYRLLLDAPTISGTDLAELTTVDGWHLTGSLLDQLPGA